MKNKRKLKKAAAEAAANAAESGSDILQDGLAKANEVLHDASRRAALLIDDAQKKAIPAVKDAGVRAADFAAKRLDDWEPHIKGALDKVTPAVEAAREKVSDDLLPRLQNMLHEAAEHPAIEEASKRSSAAVQALKGELEPVKKKSRLRKFGKFVVISAAVAGAVAAVRHFLTPKDDGWTAHEPSRAYVNNNDSFATAAKVAGETAASTATEAATDAAPVEDEDLPTDVTPEVEDVDAAAQETAEGYGEGSFIGETPPEGFEIKGNERSKKYHLPGSGGYERTIAEVWFNSEEAAEAAGFTKAQR